MITLILMACIAVLIAGHDMEGLYGNEITD